MTIKKDSGICDRLRKARELSRVFASVSADTVGKSKNTIHAWESPSRPGFPGKADLEKLSALYGVSAHWILTGEGEMLSSGRTPVREVSELSPDRLRPIPLYDIGAGPNFVSDPEAVRQSYLIDPGRFAAEDLFALTVHGDSMLPKFSPGNTLICHTRQQPQSGSFVCFWLRNGDNGFKQFFIEPDGKIRFQPLNTEHRPLVVERSKIERMFRVVKHVEESL